MSRHSSYIILEGIEQYDHLIDPLSDWASGDRDLSVCRKLFDYKYDIRQLCSEIKGLQPDKGTTLYRVAKVSDQSPIVNKILIAIKEAFYDLGSAYFAELCSYIKRKASAKAAAVTTVVPLSDLIAYAEDFATTIRSSTQTRPATGQLKAIADIITYTPPVPAQSWTTSQNDALSFGRGRSKKTGEFFAVFSVKSNDEVIYPTPMLSVLRGEPQRSEIFTDCIRLSNGDVSTTAQSIFMDVISVHESIFIYNEV